MENSFKSFIDSANSLVILLPKTPFFDQVAAGLSLYLALTGAKKDVSISASDPMTVEFNRLIGVDRIGADLGNKNLIVKFDKYDANGIEKVSYDIEKGQFVLTVIPKTAVQAPRKDQINLSYAGVAADAVILIGGTREQHFPALATKELRNLPIAHIGVKPMTTDTLQIMSYFRKASSVSELVVNLVAELGVPVSQDIATNLLSGIEVGSNGFDSSSTSPETFMIVSELMRAGGRRGAGQAQQTNTSQVATQPKAQTRTQPKQMPQQQMPRAQQAPTTTQSQQPKPVSSAQPRQMQPQTQSHGQQKPPMPTTEPEDLTSQVSDLPPDQIPPDWFQNPRVYSTKTD